jgi:hypothetical protein
MLFSEKAIHPPPPPLFFEKLIGGGRFWERKNIRGIWIIHNKAQLRALFSFAFIFFVILREVAEPIYHKDDSAA